MNMLSDKQILEYLQQENLSELGTALGISRSTLQNYKDGRTPLRKMPFDTRLKLHNYFALPVCNLNILSPRNMDSLCEQMLTTKSPCKHFVVSTSSYNRYESIRTLTTKIQGTETTENLVDITSPEDAIGMAEKQINTFGQQRISPQEQPKTIYIFTYDNIRHLQIDNELLFSRLEILTSIGLGLGIIIWIINPNNNTLPTIINANMTIYPFGYESNLNDKTASTPIPTSDKIDSFVHQILRDPIRSDVKSDSLTHIITLWKNLLANELALTLHTNSKAISIDRLLCVDDLANEPTIYSVNVNILVKQYNYDLKTAAQSLSVYITSTPHLLQLINSVVQ